MKKLLSLAYTICLTTGIWCQTALVPNTIHFDVGKWLPHHEWTISTIDGPSLGVRSSWMKAYDDGWGAAHGGVQHGLELGYWWTGSTEHKGQGLIAWNLRTGLHNRLHWEFRIGLAYSPASYDPGQPLELRALGSRLNGLLEVGTSINIAPNLYLRACIQHTSNGAVKRPNPGINSFHTGISWQGEIGADKRNHISPSPQISSLQLGLLQGARDAGSFGGTIFGVTELHLQYNHPLGPRFALIGNSALLHHGALRSEGGEGEPVPGQAEKLHERIQAAVAFGGAAQWGSVNLDMMAGYVYLRPTPGFYRTHLRTQLNIRISSQLKILILMRSTRFRADFTAIGISIDLI